MYRWKQKQKMEIQAKDTKKQKDEKIKDRIWRPKEKAVQQCKYKSNRIKLNN